MNLADHIKARIACWVLGSGGMPQSAPKPAQPQEQPAPTQLAPQTDITDEHHIATLRAAGQHESAARFEAILQAVKRVAGTEIHALTDLVTHHQTAEPLAAADIPTTNISQDQESNMSVLAVFGKIGAGLDKFTHYITSVFTKTQAVVDVLTKVSPSTLSAILAVFYDVIRFVLAMAATESANLESGNIKGAIDTILSDQTRTLLVQIATDYKAADASIVADFHQLGIAASTAANQPATTTVAPAL